METSWKEAMLALATTTSENDVKSPKMAIYIYCGMCNFLVDELHILHEWHHNTPCECRCYHLCDMVRGFLKEKREYLWDIYKKETFVKSMGATQWINIIGWEEHKAMQGCGSYIRSKHEGNLQRKRGFWWWRYLGVASVANDDEHSIKCLGEGVLCVEYV